jgi:hypothetical protein
VTVERRRVFGRALVIVGWLCVLAIPLAIVEMVESLRGMPEAWWRPPADGTAMSSWQFDLRMMVICPGPLGWLGGWGYLISLAWLPIAALHAWRRRSAGVPFGFHERVLLTVVPILIVVVQLLLRLTPLRYAYPLF